MIEICGVAPQKDSGVSFWRIKGLFISMWEEGDAVYTVRVRYNDSRRTPKQMFASMQFEQLLDASLLEAVCFIYQQLGEGEPYGQSSYRESNNAVAAPDQGGVGQQAGESLGDDA